MEELVTLDCLFIDGTKIEANANKYSFVWKKTTEKFSAKLQEQIQVYFQKEILPFWLNMPCLIRNKREDINSQLKT